MNRDQYPIEMYSGTEIPAGILLDCVNVKFFKLITIEKLKFRYAALDSFPGFLVEFQLKMKPFVFKIGDEKIMEVKGLEGESRAEAYAREARAKEERIKREEAVKKQKDAGGKCAHKECFTCARVSETQQAKIKCPKGSVLFDIPNALWISNASGVEPKWEPNQFPGLCNPTQYIKGLQNVTSVTKKEQMQTAEFIKDACVVEDDKGADKCKVAATRANFANSSKVIYYSLSVVASCYPLAMAQAHWAGKSYNDLKNVRCADGCKTCANEPVILRGSSGLFSTPSDMVRRCRLTSG